MLDRKKKTITSRELCQKKKTIPSKNLYLKKKTQAIPSRRLRPSTVSRRMATGRKDNDTLSYLSNYPFHSFSLPARIRSRGGGCKGIDLHHSADRVLTAVARAAFSLFLSFRSSLLYFHIRSRNTYRFNCTTVSDLQLKTLQPLHYSSQSKSIIGDRLPLVPQLYLKRDTSNRSYSKRCGFGDSLAACIERLASRRVKDVSTR